MPLFSPRKYGESRTRPGRGHNEAKRGYNEATTRPRRGHDEATTRPRRGHDEATTNSRRSHNEATTRPRRDHDEATAMPPRGHAVASARQRVARRMPKRATKRPEVYSMTALTIVIMLSDEIISDQVRSCEYKQEQTPIGQFYLNWSDRITFDTFCSR